MSQADKISLMFGALLHDIGKVVYRAGRDASRHAKSGADYLASAEVNLADKDILDCVRYHHADDLRGAKLSAKSPAYIVYMADNIASGVDRRKQETESGGFARDLPLASIFNLLNGNEGKAAYSPRNTNLEQAINFPAEEAPPFDEGSCKKILANITDHLKGVEWSPDYIHSLLDVMEANLSFVPSSTNKGEVADISLFSHLKLTAAFAAAMQDYLIEDGERDYRQRLFAKGTEFYAEKAFLLATLDLSGIQKFIYTIKSDGALKNLRARSFYLDFLMEHLAGALLRDMGLTRANLVYSGGGRADLLLPNTSNAQEALELFRRSVNAWLEAHFDIALYLATGAAAASANDLKNDPLGSYAEIRRMRSESIADNKAHRYSADEIRALNSFEPRDDMRECSVCKRMGNLTEKELCEVCAALESISPRIVSDAYDMIAALPGAEEGRPPLPGGYSLAAGNEEAARRWQQQDGAQLYGKNRFYTGKGVTAKLWVGDYHTGETFKELAEQATGIKRLGVFRADVDDLGAAFALGFRRPDGEERFQTVSRTAELSRQLSIFFKLHIKKILAHPEFTMLGAKKEKRHAAIVYSGGDDLFIVGAWDDVIELAVDIRRNFARFTERTLTISGGIGIYRDSYPISVMAEETAASEEGSKRHPGKNAVTLPSDGGRYTISTEAGKTVELDEGTYAWDALEEKVIGEKLRALEEFFALAGNGTGDERRNERGKNFLYNLLELLRGRDETINLARYIYLLSRMEPEKDAAPEERERYRAFADRMLCWHQDKEDSRQLKTAILLYVYLTRERNEDDHAEQ